jgi:ribosomal protein L28
MQIQLKSFSRVASIGHKVSHAKNRRSRAFKYNLHPVTVILDGMKKKIKVPTKTLRALKKAGLTSHYKAA